MTIISRAQLDHPALGTAGGSSLHTSIQTIYQKLGDHLSTRYFTMNDLADTTSTDLEHNFKTAFDDLRFDLYLWNDGTNELTQITSTTSPSISQFTIAATGGFLTTKVTVTNNSGATRDLALIVQHDPIALNELEDVSVPSPQDGQALVWSSTSSQWEAGASGDASFKVQSVTDPNASLKGGYLILDGDVSSAANKELATYDGAGSASTDFGVDLTLNLDTILGGNPTNGTTYYLYIDLTTVATSPTVLSDNGRSVYPITQSNFALLTTAPEATDQSRYVPLGFIRSAAAGTVWSGAGSAFGTSAKFRHSLSGGSAGGTGINYVTNPSAISNVTGWVASGSMTVTRTTTAANLPREGLRTTAILIENGASGDYVRYRWTMGDAEKGQPIQVRAAVKALNSFVQGDLEIEVHTNTASNYGGSYTELAVTNKDFGNASYEHLAYFVATDADYYELRIKRTNVSTSDLALCDVTVGPFASVVGPSLGNWKTYTPTISNLGTGSTSSVDGFYREVGDGLELLVGWIKDGSAGSGAASVGVSLPAGFTINSSGLSNNSSNIGGGVGYFTGGTWNIFPGYPTVDVGTNTVILISGGGGWTGASVAAGDRYQYMLRVPVNEISATTFAVNTTVEYAHNSGTWDATDTTSFSYGPGGASIGGTLTTTRLKTVQFMTPIQPTDIIKLQGSDDGITWVDINEGILNTTPFVGADAISGTEWGAYVLPTSSTTVRVNFNQYQWALSDGTSPVNWTTGKWRVVKCANPLGLGLPPRQQKSQVILHTQNGYGAVNTRINRISTVTENVGADIVYADTANDGTSLTIQTAGIYGVSWSTVAGATSRRGISKNATGADLTTNFQGLANSKKLVGAEVPATDGYTCISWQGYLEAGTVLRPHSDTVVDGSVPGDALFTISKLG